MKPVTILYSTHLFLYLFLLQQHTLLWTVLEFSNKPLVVSQPLMPLKVTLLLMWMSKCCWWNCIEKNQFLVVLKDFTDDKALERRLSVRERHLEKARELKLDRVIANGGAIFDNHQVKARIVVKEGNLMHCIL